MWLHRFRVFSKKKIILKTFRLSAKWEDVVSDIVSTKDQHLALISERSRWTAEWCRALRRALAGKAAVGLGCGQIKRRENGGFLLSKKISRGGVRWQSKCLRGGGKKRRGGGGGLKMKWN